MNEAEVIQLFIEIKRTYPNFDTSESNINTHLKYLEDMPYPVALRNLELHILKDRFPPKIADIRAGYTADQEHQRLKSNAAELFRKQEEWAATSAPPPKGGREQLYERLFKSKK